MDICKKSGLIENTTFIESPNCDERPDIHDISLIVIHNISLPPNQFGGAYISQLFTNTLCEEDHPFFSEINHLKVSSHILIRRDGEIIQYAPFHKRAWHAGVSSFQGRNRCNDFSIGIELEGTDHQAFCDQQYEVLQLLVKTLQSTYSSLPIHAVIGHEHIAPGRKTDPGPFFEWNRLGDDLSINLPLNAKN